MSVIASPITSATYKKIAELFPTEALLGAPGRATTEENVYALFILAMRAFPCMGESSFEDYVKWSVQIFNGSLSERISAATLTQNIVALRTQSIVDLRTQSIVALRTIGRLVANMFFVGRGEKPPISDLFSTGSHRSIPLIRKSTRCFETLTETAKSLALVEITEATAIFERLLRCRQTSGLLTTMRSTVTALVKKGALTDANRMAELIPHPFYRCQALLDIGNIPEATRIAETIPQEYSRSEAFLEIAEKLLTLEVPDVVEARRIVRLVPNKERRVQPFLASRQVHVAVAMATRFDDYDYAAVLPEIVETLVSIGDVSEARRMIDRLVSCESFTKNTRNYHHAKALFAIGDIGDAFRLANTLAEETRDTLLMEMFRALIKARKPERAVSIAKSLSTEKMQIEALNCIAKALIPIDFREAIRIANTIPCECSRSDVLKAVVEVVVKDDIYEATSIAETIPFEWYRSKALATIKAIREEVFSGLSRVPAEEPVDAWGVS
ncbi:MAG: hypothetical protein JSR76_05310 [Verrucomicrobia bacterium]|nr:hypothetical protein [Verrucomicrobiota bacterium]